MTETVNVKAEAPLIQAQSGERSFTVDTESVKNLPIANRSFTALSALAPGVTATELASAAAVQQHHDGRRVDGGHREQRLLLQMNVESIAEVKVLVSNYQAEYGRSSGIQITAVTKSGTNRFRGSRLRRPAELGLELESRPTFSTAIPRSIWTRRTWGYSVGGPIGKPGGNNKLFFFYAQEYAPRTAGGDISASGSRPRSSAPGDFSQSTDNNGALFPYIKDPRLTGTCSAANQAACFQYGGVSGAFPPTGCMGSA